MDTFKHDIELASNQLISVFLSDSESISVDMIIELIPVVMDIAEKTYNKKELKRRAKHARPDSDELTSLLREGCFGKHKQAFVTSVLDEISSKTNTDISSIHDHIPSIINAMLTVSSRTIKVDKHKVSCGCY